ncbi:pyridoxamine 5'-phosphate oxidase family protein [Methanohalophilus halophilus]|uniref:Pyridoxamine 5'-phosphate oxidase n=1 Tax=Methanohalophilus halophilus TaxID=2177 RepID=A0A1L3Q3K4_9EURY|nr:pyridoxamine 5'-phosphate oxidase family protein [Methanohalophilus halophilus]APH39448.1 pyridoxamine 5'-phosphate oxidase [Methanohalophilus halophilus]RNI07737.1 pyridoxamine 5'-phosphate oxidase family protein [Methanohalophilus halophilus]SDW98183.1 Pyridoxamine 5'-phosphate oxidase [Methanohalophilus halophilus]
MEVSDPEKIMSRLLTGQLLGVLATQNNGQPYTNLVAFAASENFKYLLFVTPKFTRKYSNLSSSQEASLMIDNRSNTVSDFKQATVLNAMGNVKEIEKDPEMINLYLSKHPYLSSFLESPSSALMKFQVEKYIVATSFQNVVEIDML